ncbi:EscS/YscS/HrcS family type III secretion system export apparatus protein [Burkholderia sp. WAC0059]|uniref:type III secretion system export apparatus subunit SctS n=1 Tax=Burkholderia sp. WAC0059 TaxID=2066022 RepID=UPI000C7F1753|nr:type III secretion system export apparatus subunit SctS [Burkholderia sp. WAC0059]PLZ00285.1 EscS/YscS/HrcS family type III secretion system export apparatus protein [Burkholderia sp. WAC0059]
METEDLVRLTTEGLLLCLYISLPVVVVSALAGLLVSFLQAVTSMQDQSISFGVKLVAVTVTVVIVAPWACASLLRFGNELISIAIPS